MIRERKRTGRNSTYAGGSAMGRNILVVEDIEKLGRMIVEYDEITQNMKKESGSHNLEFNREFEELVKNL